ncbi:hypothetical protein NBT05_04060 [Aquimarina sp. ERC-38]|uniref:hypothetical protein n=1 Tax=Aquimarina sp. ERC-38 TaxID=2949996 RepID=UPI002247A5EC|nr:hypothetical protein [Aquimarina sp. ERC-38]UZO81649.1 hypothetical protein NBT05_04060 [Aquimarina sp. ERC-38]
MMKLLYIITGLLLLVSCSESTRDVEDPVFCTEELRPGLEVVVKNIETDSIIKNGISVNAIDSTGSELLEFIESAYFGAFEKEGTYTLEITGADFEPFSSETPIIVESDICHVITEVREVFLVPVGE